MSVACSSVEPTRLSLLGFFALSISFGSSSLSLSFARLPVALGTVALETLGDLGLFVALCTVELFLFGVVGSAFARGLFSTLTPRSGAASGGCDNDRRKALFTVSVERGPSLRWRPWVIESAKTEKHNPGIRHLSEFHYRVR